MPRSVLASFLKRRAFAHGLFTGVYGTAWVGGSIVIGALFDVSLIAIVVFSLVAELAGIGLLVLVRSRMAMIRTFQFL